MARSSGGGVHPQLDALLDSYFCPLGASIKSISEITARSSTSPTALNRVDVATEAGRLLSELSSSEVAEVRALYQWRWVAEYATNKAAGARREAKNRGRRRTLRRSMEIVERAWNERKKG